MTFSLVPSLVSRLPGFLLRRRCCRRLGLVLLTVVTVRCSNYEFRYGPYGSTDSSQLISDLRALPDDEPPFLVEYFWIPLICAQLTMFYRTSRQEEPSFPQGGYTLRSYRGVGPFALFWSREKIRHYDEHGETYHRREGWGAAHRLVGAYSHRVATERGDFVFQEYELFFGLLKSQGDGFTRGMRLLAKPPVGEGEEDPTPPEPLESPVAPDPEETPESQ